MSVSAPLTLLNSGLRVRPSEQAPETRLTHSQRNEARTFALSIVRDPEYRANLLKAARTRTLPPAVEVVLLAYAWGKPTERVELGRPGAFDDLSSLTTDELAQRARLLAEVASSLTPEPESPEEQTRRLQLATDQALVESRSREKE